MAIWNDPQPPRGATGFRAASPSYAGQVAGTDAGLRRFMLSIYNYMMSGVLLSGIVALAVSSQPQLMRAIYGTPLRWLVALAPLGFVMAMSFGIQRMRLGTLRGLFWAFSVTMGLSLSAIFYVYTGPSIAATFFATAGAFAGLSLVGYTTRRSLSGMGSFLIMGLFGLILAMLINAFFPSPGFGLVISLLGVLIFAGLTAYDTQRLKAMYFQVGGAGDMAQRMVVMGALSLYLDFINMFQFLLSFMGDRR